MLSPYSKAPERVWLYGCCTSPLSQAGEQDEAAATTMGSNPKSTSANCRQGFAAITSSSFFPNTQFTNHENLPSLLESFAQFTKAYPKYSETSSVDQIRAQQYYHLSLSSHVCLDYIGIGLFSYSQVQSQIPQSQVPIESSSSTVPERFPDSPFFSLSCKSVNLKSQLLDGGPVSGLESAIRNRIMEFLNISQNDYSMVFTANKSSAFKLVAEAYPFQSSRKLLTVYDYDSEALQTMVNTSEKRGAKIMSAEFKWPRFRVHSVKLRKAIARKNKKKKPRGLFVIPLQSRMTGASYSYQWMSLAQENGWHVLLDCCALGPKDMDSLGLSLFRPDFLVCSFYKVIGENPTGFGCLFVKRSTIQSLEASTNAGIVNLMSGKKLSLLAEDSSGSNTPLESIPSLNAEAVETDTCAQQTKCEKPRSTDRFLKQGMTSTSEAGVLEYSGESESDGATGLHHNTSAEQSSKEDAMIECRCLDHIDSLGLMLISNRRRYLINWLVSALVKLQHPNRLDHFPLVRIYGPKVKFDRGPALSFNIYDWKGEKVEPSLVQKLADRKNISLSTGFLQNIFFSDKHEQEKEKVLEIKKGKETQKTKSKSKKTDQGITVVTIALSFLANFEDVYKLWAFIAQFLDADFVEKERWRYTALDQKTVEV
ncbi:OLC1v1027292C1 [Oldenlandia corymbosa var. corymbosa]|uniref:OLC1v1027292C1 n=1 Tax=Oldenlandia corymbosa var. corymbosa TaxID=529605 RepID=A0AAV1C9P1_OLDCO|nr:OLC1v1027292C1 [Oldenlandia corymbosa var. corymbosa]